MQPLLLKIKKSIGKAILFFITQPERFFPTGITIGKNTIISNRAVIEVRYGGEIVIGKSTEILDGVLILTYGGRITIGDNCSINPYTIIYGHGNTTIGNNVLIAGHCMIIPNNHNFTNKNLSINKQGCTKKGIIIEDDVWIAHGCSILDGVIIGKGTVVAAGSVVTKSTGSYNVIAGVPAKIVKSR
jgi:acetyltransferase-like isoleucine patch superfamily enzyme